MSELEVRVPYSAWGADASWDYDDSWGQPSEVLMHDMERSLQESGLGVQDDPDHVAEHISSFLIGADVPALTQLARDDRPAPCTPRTPGLKAPSDPASCC